MRNPNPTRYVPAVAMALATVALGACAQLAVQEQTVLIQQDASPAAAADTIVQAKIAGHGVTEEASVRPRAAGDGLGEPNGAGVLTYASLTGSAGELLAGPAFDTEPYYAVAQRSGDAVKVLSAADEREIEWAQNSQCAEFEKDLDADLGAVLAAGCEPTLAQMSALMDNPLGNVAMLFTQIDLFKMENAANGKEANKWNYMGIAQFPKGLGENWNIINRVVWNVPSMPLDQDKIDSAADAASRGISSGPGGAVIPPQGLPAPIDLFDGRTTGFGDMYYNGLFSPKKPIKLENGANFLWGAGFDLGFPTASEDILGTGKWLAGPSALGVYMGPKWKVGALAQHFWDYAGDDDRDDVNLTNLQYFIYYSLNETTSIGAAPNIFANWEQDSDNAFTVPIGMGINKTFQFGKIPIRIGVEAHYSVIQPDDIPGTEWNFRFYVIPAAPSALFKWMK